MAANTQPIYSSAPDVQWINGMTAANNTADITSGTSYLAFTADPTNGGFVRDITLKTQPANNTAASVCRIWINNGSATGTLANSVLFREVGFPTTTASATVPMPEIVVPMNLPLPAGYKIYLTWGTAAGGSGQWSAVVSAGKY